ncbi:50S ribosomal protein L22 [Mycoplasma wenyonii str. Massachusetts]|uniref:50S ribosomal protein L22 n=1 Tax=Mycoplasma wenyonii (strain Massachusetts) TaxID=1197325 RepID=I6YLG0_MYCWM|nr:uL22 family ribosomal protein [Mycoplasma wenyonii]AFN65134.1 50S ribosomal protein L22 [Mycoplasma wenyonii str. Massachusetts]
MQQQVKVRHRNLRVSPSKAIHVCRLIHRKPLAEAYKILHSIDKQKVTKMLFKLLLEAAANAVNNFAMSGDSLRVEECTATKGTMLKRTFYRAKGRTDLRVRRLTNLSVTLVEETKGKSKTPKKDKVSSAKVKEGAELSTKKIEEYMKEEEKGGI